MCVFFFRYHASLQLKRMNAQEQGEYTFYAKSDLANASITFQVQMYRKLNTNQLTHLGPCNINKVSEKKGKFTFVSNLITAVGLCFPNFLFTGRETCCCGEMGKCNYTHMHLIWLSRSQNHLVPVFWDTSYVSITSQTTVIRQMSLNLHSKLKPFSQHFYL